MKLAVLSLFRNRVWALPRYFSQIEALAETLNDKVAVVAVENNSTDKTRKMLQKWTYPWVHVLGQNNRDAEYGSVVHPERFRILSNAANIGLDFIADWVETDMVMFMESDIIWQAEPIIRLMANASIVNGLVAPMVYTERDRIFYDFWAFRRAIDAHFETFSETSYKTMKHGMERVWSAGTCLVFPKQVLLDGARFDPEEPNHGAIVSFCRKAAHLGYNTYANYDESIYHPQ